MPWPRCGRTSGLPSAGARGHPPPEIRNRPFGQPSCPHVHEDGAGAAVHRDVAGLAVLAARDGQESGVSGIRQSSSVEIPSLGD